MSLGIKEFPTQSFKRVPNASVKDVVFRSLYRRVRYLPYPGFSEACDPVPRTGEIQDLRDVPSGIRLRRGELSAVRPGAPQDLRDVPDGCQGLRDQRLLRAGGAPH